jgi:RNA polymerase sigma-70 factor (ECF subfamily)
LDLKVANGGVGAEARISGLFAEYGERLWNTALKICRNRSDAEDLTMRTFEQAFRKFDLYDESRPPFPWLCGIMANIYRMDMRGKARNAIDFFAEPPEMPDTVPEVPEAVAAMADARAVHEALARLPEQYRVLVVLRYFDDLTVPEIAAELALPEGTVKRRLHEARMLLRGDLSRTIGADGA